MATVIKGHSWSNAFSAALEHQDQRRNMTANYGQAASNGLMAGSIMFASNIRFVDRKPLPRKNMPVRAA